jgi:hypothetical protein
MEGDKLARTFIHRAGMSGLLQEVALGVLRWDTPEVVGKRIEDAEDDDQEGCGPPGLEADCNHGAGGETEDGDEQPGDTPLSLDDETDEEEDEEYTTGEEEARWQEGYRSETIGGNHTTNALFSTVRLADGRQTGKQLLSCNHRFTEDHEKTADDREVAKEEGQVEDETVTETLDDNNCQKTSYCVFSVFFGNDGA